MNEHGSVNDIHYGQNNQMDDLNGMHMNIVQTMRAIHIPLKAERFVFHVTGTILKLFQLRQIFCGFNS